MKIASHHQEHHAQREPRPLDGGNGLSFSQLLEGGVSAASISQGRAMSFAEVGILGVHYAHDLGGQPTAFGGANRFRIEQGKFETQAVEHVFSSQKVLGSIVPDPAAAAKPVLVENKAHILPIRQERLVGQGHGEAHASVATPAVTAGDELAAFLRAVAPLMRMDRKAAPFKLMVSGEANEALIVFENGTIDDGEAEELEALAQKTAAEFGVTVKRFVTRTSFGLHISGL